MDRLQHRQLQEAVKQRKQQAEDKHEEISLQKFLNVLRRKMTTTIIGSISALEEEFGDLWAENADSSNKETQKNLEKRFKRARQKILDNGNNQLRAIENELKQYTIVWNGYELQFINTMYTRRNEDD